LNSIRIPIRYRRSNQFRLPYADKVTTQYAEKLGIISLDATGDLLRTVDYCRVLPLGIDSDKINEILPRHVRADCKRGRP